MKKLDSSFIPELCFAAYPLHDFVFLKGEKRLKILADGAILGINEKKYQLEQVQYDIFNWADIRIQSYDSRDNSFTDLSLDEFDPLGEILVFLVEDTTVILKGFGDESSLWVEYTFIDPTMTVYYHIPKMIQKLGIWQGGCANFLSGASDHCAGTRRE